MDGHLLRRGLDDDQTKSGKKVMEPPVRAIVELRARTAGGAHPSRMIVPGDGERRLEEGPEAGGEEAPGKVAPSRERVRQPVEVKLAMERLIAKDQPHSLKQRLVLHVGDEGLVVRVSDQFGGNQDHELEIDPCDLAQVVEEEVRPVLGGERRAISLAEPGEETRVLVLLGDEELQRARVRRISSGCRSRVCSAEKEGAAATLAQLKVRERPSEIALRSGR